MADLMRRIEDIIRRDGGHGRIVGVTVKLGALAHISAAHFREHFAHAARDTAAAGAQLHIIESADATDPHAQDIMLESVEVSS
jgi:hydrogenase nickel incorporation protein HypA/HybF